MASMALRRLAGRDLVSGGIFRPLRSLSVSRSFNTNAQMTRVDDDRELDDRADRTPVVRRRDFPSAFFSGILSFLF